MVNDADIGALRFGCTGCGIAGGAAADDDDIMSNDLRGEFRGWGHEAINREEMLLMKRLVPPRKIPMRFQLVTVGCVLLLSGCFPQAVPLAILPLDEPEAAELNLKGIDQYHVGEWVAALQFFQSAIQVNPTLVEAYFNAGLALHQLDRHQEATQYFQRAGELDPDNASIVTSTLYRNHVGLSSTLERHLSGGYRYQQER